MTPTEIRAIRKSLGLTQSEWGLWLGVSRAQVAGMETAARPIELRTAYLAMAYRDGWRRPEAAE